jgi:hypothetical protein
VVPLLTLFRLVPLNRPAKITGVDVGGKSVETKIRKAFTTNVGYLPMLEAVKLVRADEVHLPC